MLYVVVWMFVMVDDCSQNCLRCISKTVCEECKDGYTLQRMGARDEFICYENFNYFEFAFVVVTFGAPYILLVWILFTCVSLYCYILISSANVVVVVDQRKGGKSI